MNAPSRKKANIFLRMHPLQRILISLTITAVVFLLTRFNNWDWKIIATLLWDVFALSFLITSWIIFFTRPVPDIVKQANKEDGSKFFVMISILVTSFASMLTVLLLVIAKTKDSNELLVVLLSVTGMLVSWAMVHTILAIHYAHLYYHDKKDDGSKNEVLDFPDEKKPDYLDFAYFSFVIGMTFQVSDVSVQSRKVRRTVLAHGLLSFVLNTFVVALTINIIAGLKK